MARPAFANSSESSFEPVAPNLLYIQASGTVSLHGTKILPSASSASSPTTSSLLDREPRLAKLSASRSVGKVRTSINVDNFVIVVHLLCYCCMFTFFSAPISFAAADSVDTAAETKGQPAVTLSGSYTQSTWSVTKGGQTTKGSQTNASPTACVTCEQTAPVSVSAPEEEVAPAYVVAAPVEQAAPVVVPAPLTVAPVQEAAPVFVPLAPVQQSAPVSVPAPVPEKPLQPGVSAVQVAPAKPTKQKILLVAQLTAEECPKPGGPTGAQGLGFVLLDTVNNVINLFVADLQNLGCAPSSAYIGSGPKGIVGSTETSFQCANTYVASTPYGYAFAGTLPCDSTLIAEIFANPTNYYLCITSTNNPSGAVRGQLLSPADTATILPSLLFPPELVGSSTDGSLDSALSASLTYTSITFQANVGGTPVPAGDQSSWPYLSNLTLAAQSLGNAFPAALQVMSGGTLATASSSAGSSACDDDTCSNATSGSSATAGVFPDTTLSSFVSTIIPALPALTSVLPSVSSGQLVQAGMTALLATVMAFVGFAPDVDSSQVLAALTSALNAALQ